MANPSRTRFGDLSGALRTRRFGATEWFEIALETEQMFGYIPRPQPNLWTLREAPRRPRESFCASSPARRRVARSSKEAVDTGSALQ